MRPPKRFIVKVQLSLYGSQPKQRMLVYNKDQSIVFEADVSKAVRHLMSDKHKAFFYATMDGTEILLGEPAPAQEW